MSDKIKVQHRQRKAMLYVRQSSTYQVMHNTESQRLQYAMRDRLQQLGWQQIEVIDEDLGRSASGTVPRAGFERLVAEVSLGRVGAVAAREVSRFARNSRDWQQLVEVCRIVDTLLIDQETVYAPRQSNDRLLLGLKGSLNEYELELLRERALEARLAKARRGELVVSVPAGFLKTKDQLIEKDPDLRVQGAIQLAFDKVVELGTVRQTLMWFIEQDLELPVVDLTSGTLRWRRPTYSMLYRLLTHPAYGGAYAYGKTEQVICYDDGQARSSIRRKPQARWIALIPGAHGGYLSWERFKAIKKMISENYRGPGGCGAPKRGSGLLAGLLRCRRCGRKLLVHYTGREHDMLRYSCRRGALDNGEPRCISFTGIGVDEAISQALVRVVQPGALEAAILASEAAAQETDAVVSTLARDLEAARYAAHRAAQQYDANDPDNRLVSAELERRWNQALQRVQALEQRLDEYRAQTQQRAPATLDEFQSLAADLESLWHSPHSDARLKKRIVRTLIHEVVADVDSEAGEIILIVHWQGGVHTELRVARRRRGYCKAHTAKEIVAAVRVLVHLCSDQLIAGILSRNGLLTGRGNRWTQARVAGLRSKHKIPCYCPTRQAAEGWMTLTEAAGFLDINAKTLRLAVERGDIEAQHPLSQGPWVFNRRALQTPAAAKLVERARCRHQSSTIPTDKQTSLNLSST